MIETLKELFRYVYYNSFKSESDLRTVAKSSEEEIAETARIYAESIGYMCGDELTQQPPRLIYGQKKFVWDVFFSPTDKRLPFAGGGHLRLLIDDESGKVIKKFIGTR